ncbi:MAG: hypothetical protein CME65_09660 [Halobacteriovoraceae bacterium]|nr:hypothetical protein [Halobacteriovoraceae bacterium]|tara:strand:+ start:602 stop:1291 length:690 start_codon:yes stop_codon:yes gene_type:complete
MRAVYLKDIAIKENDPLNIKGNKFHHLKNVVRVNREDDILVLDGKGLGRIYKISELNKNNMKLDPSDVFKESTHTKDIDLVIGKLKRDAMDLAVKQACELGVKNIFICHTDFSQTYSLNLDRLERIIDSAIEQSNNLIRPDIGELENIKSLDFDQYQQVFLFSLEGDQGRKGFQGRAVVMIGPEGGFSIEEEEFLLKINNIQAIKLDMPILRAATAVPCALGYVHGIYQ